MDAVKSDMWFGKSIIDYTKDELVEIIDQLRVENQRIKEGHFNSSLKWMDAIVAVANKNCC